ncbi:hypothetical protein JCM10914A_19110 [Paenibacillus sp. JCM 10914]
MMIQKKPRIHLLPQTGDLKRKNTIFTGNVRQTNRPIREAKHTPALLPISQSLRLSGVPIVP